MERRGGVGRCLTTSRFSSAETLRERVYALFAIASLIKSVLLPVRDRFFALRCLEI